MPTSLLNENLTPSVHAYFVTEAFAPFPSKQRMNWNTQPKSRQMFLKKLLDHQQQLSNKYKRDRLTKFTFRIS